jgi:hypothetical protein
MNAFGGSNVSDRDACWERVKSLHNQGRFESAADLAAAALRDHQDHAPLWELLGIACHAMKDFNAMGDTRRRDACRSRRREISSGPAEYVHP